MYENIKLEWYQHRIEPLQDKPALETLLSGLKHLDEYWLSAGTLLGLERDNEFMPLDTDLDIAVLGHWDRFKLPEDEFRPARVITDGERPMQAAYMHTETNIIFDVLHWWPHPTDTNLLINIKENGHLVRPKELVSPTAEKSYLGHTFKVPNDVDRYLADWYDDWRTPKPGAKTTWLP
jgi:hypothetical protein